MTTPWLTRYAYAVKSYLPPHIRNDVAEELLSDLEDECEYRAEALGRALNDEEIKQLLQERGHPLLVAADFLPRPTLVKESLFPIYVQLLRWLMVIIAIAHLGIGVIQASQSPALNIWQLLPHIAWNTLNGGLYGFAWLTLIFYLFGESISRAGLLRHWKADSLPRVTEQGDYISRTGSAIEIIVLLYAIAWVNSVVPRSLGHNPIGFLSGGDWPALQPWVTAILVASAALALAKLIAPYWTRAKAYSELALHIPTLILLAIINQWDSALTIVIGSGEGAKEFVIPTSWFTMALVGYGFVAAVDLIKKRSILNALNPAATNTTPAEP